MIWRRARLLLWIVLLALGGGAVGAPAHAQPAAPPPVRDIDVTERLDAEITRALGFRDHHDHAVTLGDYFDGETPVVLVLAYVRCETLCNLVLRGVAEAVHQSRLRLGEDYRVVTVSIDPRESPSDSSALRDALLELAGQGSDGRWDYLTGDDTAIRTLADELGFGYRWDQRTKQFSHPAVVFVLNGDGHIMRYLYGIRFPDAQLDAAILGAARNEAALTSQGSSPLACFRFDPSLRAHWAAVARYFAVGGLILIVVVGGGIGLLIRKERRESE